MHKHHSPLITIIPCRYSIFIQLIPLMRLSFWIMAFALGQPRSVTRAWRIKHSCYQKDFLAVWCFCIHQSWIPYVLFNWVVHEGQYFIKKWPSLPHAHQIWCVVIQSSSSTIYTNILSVNSAHRHDNHQITKKGRQRAIPPEVCLGLLLAWTRSRGSMMVLQTIFGMKRMNLSVYVRFARQIIIAVLCNDPLVTIFSTKQHWNWGIQSGYQIEKSTTEGRLVHDVWSKIKTTKCTRIKKFRRGTIMISWRNLRQV